LEVRFLEKEFAKASITQQGIVQFR